MPVPATIEQMTAVCVHALTAHSDCAAPTNTCALVTEPPRLVPEIVRFCKQQAQNDVTVVVAQRTWPPAVRKLVGASAVIAGGLYENVDAALVCVDAFTITA